MDDIVDENSLSIELQDKVMRFYNNTLEPAMTDTGRVWNIGTRWMLEDIYERFSQNEEWHTITIPAILYDEDGHQYSYWPDYWPLPKLEKKRLRMDDDVLFRIMYLCDPSAVTAALFTREQLNRDLPEILPEFISIYVTTDLAVSMKTYADFSVCYIMGIDKDRNVYLLDGIRYKDDDPESSVERIIQLCDTAITVFPRFDGAILESVAFDAVFAPLLQNRRPDIPVYPIKPRGDKMHRAKQVHLWTKQGRLFINQKIFFIQQLQSEWLNFPMHRHDDTLDAASLLFLHLHMGEITARVIRVKPSQEAIEAMMRKRQALRRQS